MATDPLTWDDVPGWLTPAQARVLRDHAAAAGPDGLVVEIGSHHGRSTVVLGLAGPRVVAIDPFPADWRYGAADTEQALRANLDRAGVAGRVEVLVATSRAVRETWDRPIDVVYVDGKHDHWTAYDDLRWAVHLRPGGVLLVHDAFSSLGVTTALLRALLGRSRLVYTGRTGSLARLVPGRPGLRDRGRVVAALPWFARNLVVKVLLRLRLVGHVGTPDPY